MNRDYLAEDLCDLAVELEKLGFGGSTILVTGVTGLVGSLAVRAICAYNRTHADKIRCVGMARNPDKTKVTFEKELSDPETAPCLSFVYQDITAPVPEGVTCDYIIHTANATASKFFMTNPVEVIDSIYTGSREIFEFGRRAGVKGLVYLSSMEVFGRVSRDDRIGEEELGSLDIHSIRSCYSEGKRLVECMAASYASEYALPVTCARLAQTFGAGVPATENRVFAQFARSAVKGEDIVLHTRGQSVGNYCYTADVIRGIFLLLKKGVPGEAYTLVNEETTRTIAEMADMVAKTFSDGRSRLVFDIPEGNAFGYAPDTKMRLSAKKMRDLGWQARYTLAEMYERMIPYLSGEN